MAEPGPAPATLSTRDPVEPKNPLSMLANWALQFPFFNPGRNPGPGPREEPKPASTPPPPAVAEMEKEPAGPTVVSFPVTRTVAVPPLEAESEEGRGKTHNPAVIWQVYAIGGFIILKWVVARWKERQERAKKPDDDNPSTKYEAPADDEEE